MLVNVYDLLMLLKLFLMFVKLFFMFEYFFLFDVEFMNSFEISFSNSSFEFSFILFEFLLLFDMYVFYCVGFGFFVIFGFNL